MNYRELYEQARTLQSKWVEDDPASIPFVRDRKADEAARIEAAKSGGFIDTEYPRLNRIIRAIRPNIFYGQNPNDAPEELGDPEYNRMIDVIYMPAPASFKSPEGYARTMVHEVSHWTGAMPSRTMREWENTLKTDRVLGSKVAFFMTILGNAPNWVRGLEELAAETSTAIVTAELGIPSQDYTLQYVRAWLDHIAEDVKGTDDMPKVRPYMELAGKDGERSAAWLLARAQ